jgi:hypothetical protein
MWNQILAGGASAAVHVVGIQTDFPRASTDTTKLAIPDLRFPVFGAAEPNAAPMPKFPVIPAAALLDGKGAVKAVWFGVPTDAQVAELRAAVTG